MVAIRSRYPLALLDIKSSLEYTVSCMSHPLRDGHDKLSPRACHKKRAYKTTLQKPNPSGLAALMNFSLLWKEIVSMSLVSEDTDNEP